MKTLRESIMDDDEDLDKKKFNFPILLNNAVNTGNLDNVISVFDTFNIAPTDSEIRGIEKYLDGLKITHLGVKDQDGSGYVTYRITAICKAPGKTLGISEPIINVTLVAGVNTIQVSIPRKFQKTLYYQRITKMLKREGFAKNAFYYIYRIK